MISAMSIIPILLIFVQVQGGLLGNCGRWSSSCEAADALNTDDYLKLSAPDKMRLLMGNIQESKNPSSWFSALSMTGIFRESMCPTFNAKGDQLPWERSFLFSHGYRNKYIHSVGNVGQIEWKSVGSHPYTGVFKGSKNALIRASLASEPDKDEKNTQPGIGLKFLRDGVDSGNMVAMFTVDGQDSWNFFKNNFTNHIPGLKSLALAPLGVKFATATKNIQQVGLSNMALYDESGKKEDKPVFPFSLNFVPTQDMNFPDDYVAPVHEQLKNVPVGLTLYKVYAMDKPAELGGKETQIANIVLSSELMTSTWADKSLFFRHQNVQDDVSLKPEWDSYLPTAKGVQTCTIHSQLA